MKFINNATKNFLLEHVLGMERLPQRKYYPKPEQSPESRDERLAAADAKRGRRQERNRQNDATNRMGQ